MPVSVILPYRDVAATIEEAARSVLDDPATTELHAIDDGSSDDGPEIVARLARSDPRVVRHAAGGVGVTRALALGVEASRYPYLARMDGDDLSLPGRVSEASRLLDLDPTLAVAGVRVLASPAPGEGLERYVEWQNGLVTSADHAREVFVEAPLCHPSVVMRRSALDAVGGYRTVDWPQDYDLWLRFWAAGYGMAKVPKTLFQWRHRPGRVTFTSDANHWQRLLAARATYLAIDLLRRDRPFVIWGAGKAGKRLARALEAHRLFPEHFIDIDPRKIGGRARDRPIFAPERGVVPGAFVVVAVGARGAREILRRRLGDLGLVEVADYLFAA
ncbi:MAG: glycosyltransferase [Polyangiaceae bacterium]|jgi:hypothetical protein|nr:glycosyltransferase [Polyangiaceae bacterium]